MNDKFEDFKISIDFCLFFHMQIVGLFFFFLSFFTSVSDGLLLIY